MLKFSLVFFIVGLCTSCIVSAQGCSDAGFCSLGNLKSYIEGADSAKNNSVSLGIGYGQGLEQTHYVNPYIEYSRKLGKSFSIQAKLTAAYASGFVGQNFDASDLFVFGTYQLTKKENSNWSFLVGAKIPLNNSNNTTSNGVALPLDYQSSIGTYDLIAGINFSLKKHWEFNAGFQKPLINENKNTFFPPNFMDERINEFAPTNHFKRKSDGLIRVGYILKVPKSKWTLKPNLLAIYHFGNDTYENMAGQITEIKNSEGLTLNGGFIGTYCFKNFDQLEFVAATPFVVRKVRPDGLTRSVVFNAQYKIIF